MPYMAVCKSDPPDGKVHYPMCLRDTACGKRQGRREIIGSQGRMCSADEGCLDCFPFLKKENRYQSLNKQA